MNTRYGIGVAAWAGALLLFASVFSDNLFAQTLDRIRLGYSGTGISSYSMDSMWRSSTSTAVRCSIKR